MTIPYDAGFKRHSSIREFIIYLHRKLIILAESHEYVKVVNIISLTLLA